MRRTAQPTVKITLTQRPPPPLRTSAKVCRRARKTSTTAKNGIPIARRQACLSDVHDALARPAHFTAVMLVTDDVQYTGASFEIVSRFQFYYSDFRLVSCLHLFRGGETSCTAQNRYVNAKMHTTLFCIQRLEKMQQVRAGDDGAASPQLRMGQGVSEVGLRRRVRVREKYGIQ